MANQAPLALSKQSLSLPVAMSPAPHDPYHCWSTFPPPQDHTAEDRIDAAISSFWMKDLTRAGGSVAQLLEMLKARDNYWRDPAYMREICRHLSDIFFLGEFRGLVFVWSSTLTLKELDEYGHCKIDPVRRTIRIVLDDRDHHKELDVKNRICAVIGTIRHELGHTFVDGRACWDLVNRQSIKDVLSGRTGHAKGWFLLAAHIEVAARRLLQLDVRLRVANAANHELEESGDVPGTPEYSRLRYSLTDAEYGGLMSWDSAKWDVVADAQMLREEWYGVDTHSLEWFARWRYRIESLNPGISCVDNG